MKRYSLHKITFLLVVAIGLTACGAGTQPTVTPVRSGDIVFFDYDGLINALQAAGATVDQPRDTVSQPFLSVGAQIIKVNSEDVQVFEYADAIAAETDANQMANNNTTMISWIAPPHFYLADKLIILYVGDNADIITVLDNLVGSQIDGP